MSSSDSVSSESKPKPCFTHLPWFLKQRIVDNTDFITRLRLRKVSKDLKKCAEKSPFNIETMSFMIDETSAVITMYRDTKTRLVYLKPMGFEMQHPNTFFIQGTDYVQRAVRDLAALFRNSKLTVENFIFGYDTTDKAFLTRTQFLTDQALFRSTFKTVFDQLPHQLNVRAMITSCLDKTDLMVFEPYLKPAVLKRTCQLVYNTDDQLQEKVRLVRKSETDPWEPEAPMNR